MADNRQPPTDKAIARRPYAIDKQYKVRDTELSGFFVPRSTASTTATLRLKRKN